MFLSWEAVTITNNIPASQAGSNDKSGTVQVHAANVSLYNLNIANTYGKVRFPALQHCGEAGHGAPLERAGDSCLDRRCISFSPVPPHFTT